MAILKIPLKCLETWSVSSLVWERGTRFKSDSARSLTEPDAWRFLAAEREDSQSEGLKILKPLA